MSSGIYAIINTVNHKCYVGSAVDLDRRWQEHQRRLRLEVKATPKLQRAWAKYGATVFVFSVLEECPPAMLLDREQSWIEGLDAVAQGYNIAPQAGSCWALWADPAFRARNIAAREASQSGDAYRLRHSEATRRALADPAIRQQLSAQSTRMWADPQYHEHIAETTRVSWEDAEVRAQRVAGLSANAQRRCSDPAERARLTERMRAISADPTVRRQRADAARARWADPEFKARASQRIRAALARRKAAQQQT